MNIKNRVIMFLLCASVQSVFGATIKVTNNSGSPVRVFLILKNGKAAKLDLGLGMMENIDSGYNEISLIRWSSVYDGAMIDHHRAVVSLSPISLRNTFSVLNGGDYVLNGAHHRGVRNNDFDSEE